MDNSDTREIPAPVMDDSHEMAPALKVEHGGAENKKARRRLTKTDIAKKDDRVLRNVFVPDWDGDVTLRTLTSAEKDAWELNHQKRDDDGQLIDKVVRARYVAMCMVDENGDRMIEEKDVEWFATKSTLVMEALYAICQEMNLARPLDLENAVKHSGTGHTADS